MGEFASFRTSNPRFRLIWRRFDSRLCLLAQSGQYFCRGLTSRLRQSKHSLVTRLCGGLNKSGQSLSLGPKKRAVSSKFIARRPLQESADCIQLSARGTTRPLNAESVADRSRRSALSARNRAADNPTLAISRKARRTQWGCIRVVRLKGVVHAQHAIAFAPVVHELLRNSWTLIICTKTITGRRSVSRCK
jgi:hypothetical protein